MSSFMQCFYPLGTYQYQPTCITVTSYHNGAHYLCPHLLHCNRPHGIQCTLYSVHPHAHGRPSDPPQPCLYSASNISSAIQNPLRSRPGTRTASRHDGGGAAAAGADGGSALRSTRRPKSVAPENLRSSLWSSNPHDLYSLYATSLSASTCVYSASACHALNERAMAARISALPTPWPLRSSCTTTFRMYTPPSSAGGTPCGCTPVALAGSLMSMHPTTSCSSALSATMHSQGGALPGFCGVVRCCNDSTSCATNWRLKVSTNRERSSS
mmetsp:Transcript_26605/g.67779  ORF Transcript_26605/g.67779 Transcript_26605/m.67779 type:complete len:269 (-) Transcript_26605:254-1060(-)